ncbi:MAG: lysine transporter LysE [Sneathiella sp.]|jgi:threonine/homoserine/homoserine lactone efflux protein|uniref:LysE family translocator n=1 Tax=Sneathiella sp. TaxID=1964365 RepID=UPI000C573065|nr:LysE family transporter [Sneathiella sp.]MAL78819.1 lysine transporter LysE [Sneathiella sp.]|tara:strand:- start:251 stop:841 length:591 start_codon:yes stop_codon:yes gene_type:complete
MITFFLAVFFLIITPGPGVLSTAGVGSAFGRQAGLRYVTGLFIGNNIVVLAVISGLAAIVFSVPVIRNILLGLSILYLLYLAFRIATAGAKIAFIESSHQPGLFSGITLQFINPKAYAVNTALFTGFPFMPDALAMETLFKFLLLNAIWIPVHLLWLGAGIMIKRLELAPHIQFRINLLMALAMLAVVALALFSNL